MGDLNPFVYTSALSALSQDLWRRLDFGPSLSLTFFSPYAARLTSRQHTLGLIYAQLHDVGPSCKDQPHSCLKMNSFIFHLTLVLNVC